MPVSSTAIERYLDTPPPKVPKFKGMRLDDLYDYIEEESRAPYRPKTKPWRHQLEGLAFSLYTRQAMLYYWMRTGKTRIALEYAYQLRLGGLWQGPGLVVAHAPIGLDVWAEQIRLYAPGFRAAFVRNDVYEFMDALDRDYDLIVTPWVGLQTMFTVRMYDKKKFKERLVPDRQLLSFASENLNLCIMDEIHMCKNHKSVRFRNAADLSALCEYRLTLTGTPLGRSGYAIWAQAFLTDRGKTLGHNYYFFEQAFGTAKKNPWVWGGKEWKFDKKLLPDLRWKLSALAMTYELHEIRDVDVRPKTVRLKMRGDQRDNYKSVVEQVIAMKQDEQLEIKNTFVRLRQIASGYLPFIDDDGIEHVVDFRSSAKMEWLLSFLEDTWNGEPFVIFHEFTHTGELICRALQKARIKHTWFYGGTKEPEKALNAFKSGKVDAIVANTAKGNAAIDLNRADYMVFFESPVDPIVRQQAEARPLAASRGKRPLLMDDLICAPIEERVLGFVHEGRDAMGALMGDRKSLRLE